MRFSKVPFRPPLAHREIVAAGPLLHRIAPPDGLIDPWVPPESGPGLQTRPARVRLSPTRCRRCGYLMS